MRDGTAYVQAGGGVVADSNGPYEYNEAANKAKAVLSAIAAAETLTAAAARPVPMAEPGRSVGPSGSRNCCWSLAALGLWVASRLTWVVSPDSFDGLGQPKTTTLDGGAWSTALLPLALLLLAAAVAGLAVRGWPLRLLALLVAAAERRGGLSGDQPVGGPRRRGPRRRSRRGAGGVSGGQ